MHQVPENSKFEGIYLIQVIEFFRIMVRCGALTVLAYKRAVTCGQPGKRSRSMRPQAPLSRSERLREDCPGEPGEPQTLDPQIADDTYSFQVLRDLYEG